MKDLCDSTGLSRQSIHFYIKEGLLQPGEKTGRNVAWYGPEHVERLQLVRRLQRERFLPLKAIKALLDGREELFSPDQRDWLRGVKARVTATLGDDGGAGVPAGPLLAEHHVTEAELLELAEVGIVAAGRDDDGVLRLVEGDAWAVRAWGQLKREGFAEAGLRPADLAIYEEAVSALFQREAALMTRLFGGRDSDDTAGFITRALPLAHELMTRLHTARVRQFFDSME